jgi:hypothetical protein
MSFPMKQRTAKYACVSARPRNVHARLNLRRRPRKIDRHRGVSYFHGRGDSERFIEVESVVVEESLDLDASCGPGAQLRARTGRGLLEDRIHCRDHGRGFEAMALFADALDSSATRRNLGGEVSDRRRGLPNVGCDELEQRIVALAAAYELHGGE